MSDFEKNTVATHEWLGNGSVNIFGRPFAGKDTQAERLAKLFEASILGGGNILRNSVIPLEIKANMESGGLIPSEAYVEIVLPYLSNTMFADHPLILSSVGRVKGEQEGVIAATEQAGHPLRAVIYLDVDEETVRRRWQVLHVINNRGDRHDDTEAALETRLAEFNLKTLPVIDDYRARNLLIEIDGCQSEDDVTVTILNELAKRALSSLASASL